MINELGLNVILSLSEMSISFLISMGEGKGLTRVINFVVVSLIIADISIFYSASGG